MQPFINIFWELFSADFGKLMARKVAKKIVNG